MTFLRDFCNVSKVVKIRRLCISKRAVDQKLMIDLEWPQGYAQPQEMLTELTTILLLINLQYLHACKSQQHTRSFTYRMLNRLILQIGFTSSLSGTGPSSSRHHTRTLKKKARFLWLHIIMNPLPNLPGSSVVR